MDKQEQKIAAALAAVSAYLQMEQEAIAQAAADAAQPAQPPAAAPNFWGRSGRAEMMGLRSLMQMRAISRLP